MIQRLNALRRLADADAVAEKLRLIGLLRPRRISGARTLAAAHAVLLFLLAFPDDERVRAAAAAALAEVAARIRRLPAAARRTLDDSGLEGTVTRYTVPFGIAQWLAREYAAEVAVDWAPFTERAGLDDLVRHHMTAVEGDALDAGTLDAHAWLRLAGATTPAAQVRWILGAAGPAGSTRAAATYDAIGIPLRWRLARSPGSVTRNRDAHALVVHRVGNALRAAPRNAKAFIATPLRGITRATGSDVARILDVARAALTARCREVDAISYPNPDEVHVADLGMGAQLAVIGAAPAFRMGLEANYGYVLFSNGVPTGYGGVSPLFFDANTGINIFESFRGGEAAYLWAAMLRTFRTLFGTTRFVVNAFQFGEGNREAIASGAFWFYHRLGFRPAAVAARRLASREAARMRTEPRHRSSPATLRALATGDMHLVLPGFRRELAIEEAWLPRIARGVARAVPASSATARARAVGQLALDTLNRLGVSRREAARLAADAGVRTLAPVVSLLDGIERWPASSRRALIAVMRAKGGAREQDYVRLAQRHTRFLRALRAWCLDNS